jgi:hypothetical protein
MTDEQRWDRLERIARLLAQPDLRRERESREQLAKLKALVEKHRKEDEVLAKSEKAQKGPDNLDKLKALVEKHRKDDERLANLKKAQKPPKPLDPDNS